MKLKLKIKEFELLDKETFLITANVEDFKEMLDSINPLHITDYLREAVIRGRKGQSNE